MRYTYYNITMMQPTKITSSTHKQHRKPSGFPLPQDYQPSAHTVIIGRGRLPKMNIGNKRLQVLAQSFLKKYQEGDKKCKTDIVSDMIGMVRDACKGGKGAFVKQVANTTTSGGGSRWYELDNSAAREKIGYVFRNLLADQYKSSAKSKGARRHRSSMTYFPVPLNELKRQRQSSMMDSEVPSVRQQRDSATLRGSDDESIMSSPKFLSSSSLNKTLDHDLCLQATERHKKTTSDDISMGISDIIFQSSASLLDKKQQQQPEQHQQQHSVIAVDDDIFRVPVGSWSSTAEDDDEDFDYESLLRMPLLW